MEKQGCQTYTFDKTGESRQKTISRLWQFLWIYGLEIRGTWKTPGRADQAVIQAGWGSLETPLTSLTWTLLGTSYNRHHRRHRQLNINRSPGSQGCSQKYTIPARNLVSHPWKHQSGNVDWPRSNSPIWQILWFQLPVSRKSFSLMTLDFRGQSRLCLNRIGTWCPAQVSFHRSARNVPSWRGQF